ncbi:MAG: hypothetical protein VB055_05940 [Oscillospiraceae bacterium]|nr:hypothetical protein [Oscillospiraceae bacterium]
MDPYDKEKTRQIWKRVLGEDESSVEMTAMDSEKLRDMIADEKTDSCTYRKMAQSACGKDGEVLRCVAQEEYCHSRKLETVYYIWTGEKAQVVSNPLPQYCSMPEALRDRYQKELEGEKGYRQAAEELPEHRDLLLCLAAGEAHHAEIMRCLLQHYV